MKRILRVITFLTIMSVSTLTWAIQEGTPFSADVTMTNKGKITGQGKYYSGDHATRMDLMMGKTPQTQIFRIDRDIIWSVMPEQNMYLEMPLQYNAMVNKKWEGTTETCSGMEVVNGHKAEKCLIEVKMGGKRHASYIWKSSELGAVIKTVDEKGKHGMELQNIRKGPQSVSLFEEPTGMKKIKTGTGLKDMMQGVMGQ